MENCWAGRVADEVNHILRICSTPDDSGTCNDCNSNRPIRLPPPSRWTPVEEELFRCGKLACQQPSEESMESMVDSDCCRFDG